MRRLNKTLLATASIAGLCAALAPVSAHAASSTALQAEITSLQSQLNALQAQVAQQAQAAKIAHMKAMMVANAPKPKPKYIKPLVGGAQPAITTGDGGYLFITGDIDAGLRLDTGAGHSILSVQSGGMRADRITFEGYQDTSLGIRIVGIIEGGFNIAQGIGASNPGAAGSGVNDFDFGRYSAAGFGNDTYGYIDFGRQYTPIWSVAASGSGDPFGGSYLGGIAAINPTLATNSRASNAITYSYGYSWEGMLDPAPRLGYGFAALFAPGQGTGHAGSPLNAGMQYGFGTSYGTKLFWVGAAWHQINGINLADSDAPESATYVPAATTQKPILSEVTLAASYVTPWARLFAQFDYQNNNRKIDGVGTGRPGGGKAGVVYDGVNQDDWFVGAVIPTIAHENLRAMYGEFFDHTNLRAHYNIAQASYEFDLTKAPGCAIYIEGSVIANNKSSASGILGATNVGFSGVGILPTQLSANGTKLDYGATSDTVATGVRYIF
jgi:predicted porin